jgi:hypothetical protein
MIVTRAARPLALLTLLLAGCTGASRPEGRIAPYLETYRTQPHYRAFAVARGTSYGQSYGLGSASAADSVQQAIDVALAYCRRDQDPSMLAGCKLYALGDIQVYDMDDEQLAVARCVYAGDIDARSIEGATLESCRAAAGPANPDGRSLGHYRSLAPYRALAAAGDPGTPGATLGWSQDAVSLDGAIDAAIQDCEARRPPSQPDCRLHAIGDIVVAGVSETRIQRARCLAILDPAAASLEGPDASRCATAAMGLPSGEAAGDGTTRLTAADIRARLIGNTALSLSGPSHYVQLSPDGRASLRSGREPRQDTGTWRIDESGRLCLRWQRQGAGQEACSPVSRSGTTYGFADADYALIRGTPLEL